MARKKPNLVLLMAIALGCAGAGTWAAMRATHTPVPPLPPQVKAAPAKVRAVALQMRQAPDVVKQHLPSHVIERAVGAIGAYGPPAPVGGHAAPAAAGGGWSRQPLGRGEIIEKR
jgi:hypothetical protein